MKTLPSLTCAAGLVAAFLLAPLRAWPVAAETKTFPELGLTLELPDLAEMTETLTEAGQTRGTWRGKLGEARITVQLAVLPTESFGFSEPDDVAALLGDNVGRDPNATFERTGMIAGPYGFAPYAALAVSKRHLEGSTKPDVASYYLCGLTETAGYVIEVECRPALEGKAAEPVLAFLKDGVRYDGPTRINEWTDEEAVARYMRDTPEDCHDEMEKILRTKHYIILTNSSGGKTFGKKMEENYEEIKAMFPFEEVEGRKLMPIFLFQTNEEYYDFCTKIANWDRAQAAASKGHAWKDYYATWYEAPGDPVHIHEATHQIFANRLGLHGGGSWFQEGVAEYVESSDNDRNAIATQVKKGHAPTLKEFVLVGSLIDEGRGSKTGSEAGSRYKQAALFIEFLAESKAYKKDFQRFIHTMGKAPRGNAEAIEAVFQEIYGKDLDELQEEFVTYCKKR
jgi:hypothetical protein